jgi:cell division protein FtsN
MKFQRGGFVMGLIVGLMVGLAIALGVALYVTKVPVPFVNKVPQRTAEQDAAEAEKNKNWDPNAPLHGKNPARPNMNAASGVVTPASQPATPANPPQAGNTVPTPNAAAPAASKPAVARRDPADILADKPAQAAPVAAATSTKPGADAFSFFVQVGAYARPEDADAQRAKLAMMGMGAKITEREQAGRTVYRVRVGPFDHKEEADGTKEKLDAAGMESSLVRVQR